MLSSASVMVLNIVKIEQLVDDILVTMADKSCLPVIISYVVFKNIQAFSLTVLKFILLPRHIAHYKLKPLNNAS